MNPRPLPDSLAPELMLEHLQAFAHIGFAELDLVTSELYLSTQAFEILDIDMASVPDYLEAVHPEDRAVLHQVVGRARAQAGPYRLRHRTSDGARLLQIHVQSLAGPAGRPVRLIAVISDVTAEWRLERALEDGAPARLTGQLAGGAVHDLKNIFVVLLGHSQLALAALDRGQLPDREGLEALQRAATQGVELTQHLLHVGRPEPTAGTRVDLEQLFRRLATTARTALGRGRDVLVDPGDVAFDVLVDEAGLERAVVDLLLNARDALPDGGGSVRLSFRVLDEGSRSLVPVELGPGAYGMLEVADDGVGMEPEILDKVTAPWFTTKGSEGSGVGLHAVARFVERAGGALRIDSSPGAGTRVQLVLPIGARVPEPARDPRRRRTATRVLIHGADDHRVRLLAAAMRARGLQCLDTSSGGAAAAALRTEPIDLLVVDDTVTPDAGLLRAAASTTTPVLNTADVSVSAGGQCLDETWPTLVVDAAEELVGMSDQPA